MPEEPRSRRAHDRVEWRAPVRLVLPGRTVLAETRNVSVGGLLIATMATLEHGQTIKLVFRLPTMTVDTETDAIVRWSQPNAIGVQLVGLRAVEIRALHQLLR